MSNWARDQKTVPGLSLLPSLLKLTLWTTRVLQSSFPCPPNGTEFRVLGWMQNAHSHGEDAKKFRCPDGRGFAHTQRIQANDPSAIVQVKIIK